MVMVAETMDGGAPPPVCPHCWRGGKRVPLVAQGRFWAHGEGERRRGCGVHLYVDVPAQPDVAELAAGPLVDRPR